MSGPARGRDAQAGEPRTLLTHLFDFIDTSDGDSNRSTVRYGLPKKLVEVLARSNRWGRIKVEVVCAMTSKYSIALYEMVQLRANMDRCVETFPLARFRDLLGVPPKTYERGNDFARFVIQPAMLEINGLSDMSVDLALVRRNKVAPIEAVTLTGGGGRATHTGRPAGAGPFEVGSDGAVARQGRDCQPPDLPAGCGMIGPPLQFRRPRAAVRRLMSKP